eukprot:1140360-Pelagomonas_calceolata.AAC.2
MPLGPAWAASWAQPASFAAAHFRHRQSPRVVQGYAARAHHHGLPVQALLFQGISAQESEHGQLQRVA